MSENPLTHLVFDIETLGLREDCVILSAAVVPFTFEEHEYFEAYLKKGIMVKFEVNEQVKKYHRSYGVDTIDWWKKQPQEAREMNLIKSVHDVRLPDGLKYIAKFISQSGYIFSNSYVFARGTYFDFPKLEHAWEVSCGMKVPFNTYMIRDVRTYIDIFAGVSNGKYDLRLGETKKFIPHNPLHDAAMDAARMNELYYYASEEPPF
jgi:hypothetical protein